MALSDWSNSPWRFFTTRIVKMKPNEASIDYQKPRTSSTLSTLINNLCQVCNVLTKKQDLADVYGFYFTQCVCTGSIERSTLSLFIYYYELLIALLPLTPSQILPATTFPKANNRLTKNCFIHEHFITKICTVQILMLIMKIWDHENLELYGNIQENRKSTKKAKFACNNFSVYSIVSAMLNWTSLKDRRDTSRLAMMHKILII